MQIGNQTISINRNRIELARKCLRLISELAARGARSQNPENIGYVLQELSQVLLERTGAEARVFEPVAADQLLDLTALHTELDWINGGSIDLIARESAIPFGILPIGNEHMS